jgi:hypothetical protein
MHQRRRLGSKLTLIREAEAVLRALDDDDDDDDGDDGGGDADEEDEENGKEAAEAWRLDPDAAREEASTIAEAAMASLIRNPSKLQNTAGKIKKLQER